MSIPTDRGYVRIGQPDEGGSLSVEIYSSPPDGNIKPYAVHTGSVSVDIAPGLEFADEAGARVSAIPLAATTDGNTVYLTAAEDATV
jgi:hypothetical protein